MGFPQQIESGGKRTKEVDPVTPPRKKRRSTAQETPPVTRVQRRFTHFTPLKPEETSQRPQAFLAKVKGTTRRWKRVQNVRCQEGQRVLIVEVGDVVEAELGKRRVLGEICQLIQDEQKELKMVLRHLLGRSEMELRNLSREAIQERELVDSKEVLELPLATLLEKVTVLTEEEFLEFMEDETIDLASLGTRPFFCRHQLESSDSLWSAEWNDENRKKRRQEALRLFRPDENVVSKVPLAPTNPKELLMRAATALKAGAANGDLPGRETEQERVMDFLRTSVKDGGRKEVLYVSGVPGTGKTASVLEAVRRLQAARKPQVQSVYVNAMSLATPSAVFGEILRQVASDKPSKSRESTEAEVRDLVRKAFTLNKPPVTILLIDEVDALLTKAQSVLYQIFDLVSHPSARLAVVAIANTMDLPERLLPRVASRIGVRRVSFNAYSRDQLKEILVKRLRAQQALDAFQDKALTICAARVAADGGDARKALQVCRRAIEACLSKGLGQVSFEEMTGAQADLLQLNPAAMAITGLPPKAQQLLLAMVLELRKQSAHVVAVHKVLKRFQAVVHVKERMKAAELDAVDVLRDDAWNMRCWDAGKHDLIPRLQAVGIITLIKCADGEDVTNGTADGGCVLELGQSLDVEDLVQALSESLEEAAQLLDAA